MHPCIELYSIAAQGKNYGNDFGICRVTGQEAYGIIFKKWVSNNFTDYPNLKSGTIISNEALFCFDEQSEALAAKLNKPPQKFRNYSHIVLRKQWYPLTKANKREIYALLIQQPEIVCLSDSGQKHLFFKNKRGFWQLEESHFLPDLDLFKLLHATMCELLALKFSQTEIISGNYYAPRIMVAGLTVFRKLEAVLKPHRGTKIFDFTSFLLYTD